MPGFVNDAERHALLHSPQHLVTGGTYPRPAARTNEPGQERRRRSR